MNYSTIPEELKQTGLFCCWRYEDRGGRKTKVPYQPATGERAKSNDPGSFVPFQQAVSAKGYDGIGVGIFDGICAIDLDDCITEEGRYTQNASEIIGIMHSYTELSPSGRGVHILFRAEGFAYDTGTYYIMNHKQGLEVYVAGATSKYVTVTGRRAHDYPFGERSKELSQVLERFMRRATPQNTAGRNGANGENNQNAPNPDSEVLERAAHGKHGAEFQRLWAGDCTGYPSQSEADLALCGHLAFWTLRDAAQMDRLFRRSGLMREKWDRPQCGTTYGAITIQKAMESCTAVAPVPKDSFEPIIPLNPQRGDLPPFPVDCLPATVAHYARAVAAHSQTSVDMAAVIGLGVLSVCLQGKYLVEGTPGYVEPLSLYTVVIASPGERKSGVMRDMTRYLYDYEREYNKAHEDELRSNRQQRETLNRKIDSIREQLKRKEDRDTELELRDLEQQLEELPELSKARFFADDCSSEALTSLMAKNKGVFSVLSTEGGIFDIMTGRYSNKANLDVWLKGHCGDPIRVDRMGRDSEYIPHPALSAIMTIQPSVLDEIMENDVMSGRGLIARFLYACPPSQIGQRVFCAPPIPYEIEQDYKELIYDLMDIPIGEEPCLMTLSPSATDRVSAYFREHERFLAGEGQTISDWAGKYIGAILRIAGLIHVIEPGQPGRVIQSDTIDRAIQIGRYFLAHSLYAYSMMGTDLTIKKARFVLSKLKKERVETIKRSELLRMCRGKFFRKVEDILPTLELLESHHYIRLEEPPKGMPGRPPDWRVVVNPALWQKKAAA